MNEQSLNQLSEQLGSIVRRAKRLTTWPLTEAEATLPLLTRREADFGFDEATKNDFEDLISKLLKNHKWSEKYSERFLSDQLLDYIAQLIKENRLESSQSCLKKLVADHDNFNKENVVFIPLGGIALNLSELVVGNITIRKIPRNGTQEPFGRIDPHIIRNPSWAVQHEAMKNHLFGGHDIVEVVCAEFRVVAEPKRAEERAVEECNRVLELLRFSMPSLYKDFERVEIGFLWEIVGAHGAVLTVEALTPAYHCSSRIVGPATFFELGESTTQALESLGIFRVGEILQKKPQETNEFEKAILRAIHWYSASVSQSEIENKFLNLLISIESLLTPKEREPIANAIAEGVALVLGDDLENRRRLKKRMKELYSIRSGLSHGGSKEILESDLSHLQDIAGKLLVWVIKQVDGFKSHQELFDWIEMKKFS